MPEKPEYHWSDLPCRLIDKELTMLPISELPALTLRELVSRFEQAGFLVIGDREIPDNVLDSEVRLMSHQAQRLETDQDSLLSFRVVPCQHAADITVQIGPEAWPRP